MMLAQIYIVAVYGHFPTPVVPSMRRIVSSKILERDECRGKLN
jgi:hypothetical protein